MISDTFLPAVITARINPISIILLVAAALLFLSAVLYFFDRKIESVIFVVMMGFIVSAFVLLNAGLAIFKIAASSPKKIWLITLTIITLAVLFVLYQINFGSAKFHLQ